MELRHGQRVTWHFILMPKKVGQALVILLVQIAGEISFSGQRAEHLLCVEVTLLLREEDVRVEQGRGILLFILDMFRGAFNPGVGVVDQDSAQFLLSGWLVVFDL